MKTGETTDALLESAAHGDRAAFEALHDRFAARLAHYVSDRMVGRAARRMEPEDLVQEVFAEVFTKIDRYRPRGKGTFYKLLITIANRRLINIERRLAAGPAELSHELGGPSDTSAGFDFASLETGPLTALLRAEDRELCRKAFLLLSEGDREILWLRMAEERGAKEISELTGKSIGAVWVWFHRALKAWSAKLEELRGNA
ncbi:MAG TPA: sigma-70 family RNA polymerase sigma factor [Planctomycetota bacterium]|nr:sigma-70 family RNA polymerase sigma factor [Planctomycetota bacterium]